MFWCFVRTLKSSNELVLMSMGSPIVLFMIASIL